MTADERYTFEQARGRLEEIVTQVRKKDTSLERSLDLLEEGVHLANMCTELSDATRWREIADGDEPTEPLKTSDVPEDAAGAVTDTSEAQAPEGAGADGAEADGEVAAPVEDALADGEETDDASDGDEASAQGRADDEE